jgi:hypothetical protein
MIVMLYRDLGRTGLKVPCSPGGAAFGQQYGPVSLAEATDCMMPLDWASTDRYRRYYGKGRSKRSSAKC